MNIHVNAHINETDPELSVLESGTALLEVGTTGSQVALFFAPKDLIPFLVAALRKAEALRDAGELK